MDVHIRRDAQQDLAAAAEEARSNRNIRKNGCNDDEAACACADGGYACK